MHRTKFAGLTAPDPDDAALQVDGGSFANRNPDIIDFFLSIGAVTHRHDAHPPLASPQYAPSATISPSGGTIESGLDLYFGWTASDSYGGETVLSPATLVSTVDQAAPPTSTILAEFVSSAGVMPTGTYDYAITVMDAGGGEGVLGPSTTVQREAGFASGQVYLSGLTDDLLNDGDRWRLWRADNGGPFNLIAVGTTADFVDYGIDPVDHAATPPLDSSRTRATSSVNVTLPEVAGASANAVLQDSHATGFNLYLSLDGTFASPALVAVFPIASAGVTITLTDTFTEPGAPPEVATSIRGANKIDPDFELIDWHWKRPVAASGDLPLGSATASGDVRMVISEGVPYTFTASGWGVFPDPDSGGGAGGSGVSVFNTASGTYVPAPELTFLSDTGLVNRTVDDGSGGQNVIYGMGSTREFVTWASSAAVASGATVSDVWVNLGIGYVLLALTTEGPYRIRIYVDAAHRDADLSRPLGTPPTGDHGCVFEFLSGSGENTYYMTPGLVGANFDASPPTADVAISVTNYGAALVLSAGMTRLLLEA